MIGDWSREMISPIRLDVSQRASKTGNIIT